MFEALFWNEDGMTLRDLTFQFGEPSGDMAARHFALLKTQALMAQYAAFFARRPAFRPRHIFEIGIYDGGSTAMWFELLQPQRHVAIDFQHRGDSGYFKAWKASRDLGDRVKSYWRTDQADQKELLRIINRDLDGRVDLVVDDASHLYAPTKASFEALFPAMAPGAVYVIEDWAWDHWPGFDTPEHLWASERRLTDLVVELVEMAGTSADLASDVEVRQGFVAIERGPLRLAPGPFSIDDHIRRRGARPLKAPARFKPPSLHARVRRYLSRLRS